MVGRAAARREAANAAREARQAIREAEQPAAPAAEPAAESVAATAAGEALVAKARSVVRSEQSLVAMTGMEDTASDRKLRRRAEALAADFGAGLEAADTLGLSADGQRVVRSARAALEAELARVAGQAQRVKEAVAAKAAEAEADDVFTAERLEPLRREKNTWKPMFSYEEARLACALGVGAPHSNAKFGAAYLDQFTEPLRREMLVDFAEESDRREHVMNVTLVRAETDADGSTMAVVEGTIPPRVEEYFQGAQGLLAMQRFDEAAERAGEAGEQGSRRLPAAEVGCVVTLDFQTSVLRAGRHSRVFLRFQKEKLALRALGWLREQKFVGKQTPVVIVGKPLHFTRVTRSIDILKKEPLDHPLLKAVLPARSSATAAAAAAAAAAADQDGSESVGPSGSEEEAAGPVAPAAAALNESQAAAVRHFCNAGAGDPVTIVEGPPGTGKTRTVAAALQQRGVSRGSRALVVAPSNAALHVLMRGVRAALPSVRHILTGVAGKTPDDLRAFSPDCVAEALKDRMLHLNGTLFGERRVDGTARQQAAFYEEVQAEVEFLNAQLDMLVAMGVSRGSLPHGAHVMLRNGRTRLDADAMRRELHAMYSELMDIDLQQLAIQRATVVFTTAMASGRGYFQPEDPADAVPFATLVVDEAAHFTEAEMLIPLATVLQAAPRDARLLMVGDVKQLAGQGSEAFKEAGYAASLMEVLLQRGLPSYVLQTQYRMHPQISAFPFREFYPEDRYRLRNARWVEERPSALPGGLPAHLGPLSMVHSDGEERKVGTSFCNDQEVAAVLDVLWTLHAAVEDQVVAKGQPARRPSVAVITFYRAQVELLDEAFAEHGLPFKAHTVDAFQGEEFDVVVLSMVRNRGNGFGFVNDRRRLNVALTRARHSLVIVGSHTFMAGSHQGGAIAALAAHVSCSA